jgi:predicted cytidylate kinase
MKKIICLTGTQYSGKSTAGKLLAEKLGYEYFSGGSIFRNIAAERGMDVLELNQICEEDNSIDELIDSKLVELGETKENIIIDSRMSWHFAKEGYRVFVTVDKNEAARRALSDYRGNTESYDNLQDAIDRISQRREVERTRYLHKYGVDVSNMDNYDLVVDTTGKSPEEVVNLIMDGYNSYLKRP